MEHYKFFKFLEKKEQRKIPYNIKFIEEPESYEGKKILDLVYHRNENIKFIPDNLNVRIKTSIVNNKNLAHIGKNLKSNVIILENCKNLKKIEGGIEAEEIYINSCENLEFIGNDIFSKYLINISHCPKLIKFPSNVTTKSLEINDSSFKNIPKNLKANDISIMGSYYDKKYNMEEFKNLLIKNETNSDIKVY